MTLGLRPAAWWQRRKFTTRIRHYEANQSALRDHYGLTPDTLVVGYRGDTQARIEALAASSPGSYFAATSGSTHTPKRTLFTRERISRFKRQSQQAGICTFAHFKVS